ncbi:MAG: 16S rRNA (guanine(527)-N(7))-methyltransferase RsmG [Vicinamibacteria bacterium]|nr:16S rRNA (guanine(527)-N(7))-methyltransferase RsmG [Vicinamibacteria bacterium]
MHWSPRINLTGAQDAKQAFETLIQPTLGAENLLTDPVIDVGSGNGSPGLILAALRPDLEFTLLEPRAKRWAFLRDAARQMNAANVTVLRERSDAYKGPKAATVTMRAVGLDPEALRSLIAPGGTLLVFGGPELSGTEAIKLPSGSTVQRRCFT